MRFKRWWLAAAGPVVVLAVAGALAQVESEPLLPEEQPTIELEARPYEGPYDNWTVLHLSWKDGRLGWERSRGVEVTQPLPLTGNNRREPLLVDPVTRSAYQPEIQPYIVVLSF